jgi:hypothetical protein
MAIPLTDGIEEISEDSWSLKQGRANGATPSAIEGVDLESESQ